LWSRVRLTLAGQLLVLQLGIVLVVLAAVAAVSLAQARLSFERDANRRVLSVAETVAATPVVRSRAAGRPLQTVRPVEPLDAVVTSARSVSGSSVMLAGTDARIITNDDLSLRRVRLPAGGEAALSGRAWTGRVELGGRALLVAVVPVFSDDRRVIGMAVVGQDVPTLTDLLAESSSSLLTYLGIASLLGVAGSWLIARRIKRQTLGLEPPEIVRMVELHEAMLHGVKEGVLALDPHERVTLANDVAAALLELPPAAAGRTLDDLGVSGRLRDVLTGVVADQDAVVVVGGRVLVLNRRPITKRGRPLGSVTTLRDRTELAELEGELGGFRATADLLRVQTHEFDNQLHTISGLIEIGEVDEAVRYVQALTEHRERVSGDLGRRIADAPVAALLLAKSSRAAELGVDLQLTPSSRLGRLDDDVCTDLATVLGNLVDNALDAVPPAGEGWVEVDVRQSAALVEVTVRDNGPGVAPEIVEEVFRQGFSTKQVGPDGGRTGRGVGLALSREVCRRRGGDLRLLAEAPDEADGIAGAAGAAGAARADGLHEPGAGAGATFHARLPLRPAAAGPVAPGPVAPAGAAPASPGGPA
jgi:two-component system CitB family sensor kinase